MGEIEVLFYSQEKNQRFLFLVVFSFGIRFTHPIDIKLIFINTLLLSSGLSLKGKEPDHEQMMHINALRKLNYAYA